MPFKRDNLNISVTQDAVDVSYTPSVSEPRGKLIGFIFIVTLQVLLACALLFLPGKQAEASMWHELSKRAWDSPGFIWRVVPLTAFLALFGWQGFRYARAAWPSDEVLHCNRTAITISRVPWLDFSNLSHDVSRYQLQEVHRIRFAVIASAKGKSFFGLRFNARGRKWLLPGLRAAEAKVILTGLSNLGADVMLDEKLEKRIDDEQQMRFGDTTWMDRSWMEHEQPLHVSETSTPHSQDRA